MERELSPSPNLSLGFVNDLTCTKNVQVVLLVHMRLPCVKGAVTEGD